MTSSQAVNDAKAILVTRRTRFDALLAQYNTEAQAEFVIQSRGGDFGDYRLEHKTYCRAIKQVEMTLKQMARIQHIEREFLPNFIFGPHDIVVVVGQDGLVANTLKYLDGQPLIAVNPDPVRYDGVLLPFLTDDVGTVFRDVVTKTFQKKNISMAKATLNDGQALIAVNDLFIGPRYQTSAQYMLSINGKSEEQLSSGIIVSTGLGSTGWIKSIFVGALGLFGDKSHVAGVKSLPSSMSLSNPKLPDVGVSTAESPWGVGMPWDAARLQFAVREPFPSHKTGTDMIYGDITARTEMRVASLMAGNGIIFSDGMVDDFLAFNSGVEAKLGLADKVGVLVV